MPYLKNIKIIDTQSTWNGKNVDLYWKDNKIVHICKAGEKSGFEIEENAIQNQETKEELLLSPGWVDIGVRSGEPYFEERDSLESTQKSAIAGGFTNVGMVPYIDQFTADTQLIESYNKYNQDAIVSFYPFVNFIDQRKGEEMCEYSLLKNKGVQGFYQSEDQFVSDMFLKNILEYVQPLNKTIILNLYASKLRQNAIAKESSVALEKGLKQIPSLVETIQLQKIFSIVDYTKSPVHIAGVSLESTLDFLIKNTSPLISSQVSVNNIYFDENDMQLYEVNKKVLPPFNSKNDRDKIIEALKKGVVKCVFSDHTPWNQEKKEGGLIESPFGSLGMESFFGALYKSTKDKLGIEEIIKIIAINPREIFNLKKSKIEVGECLDFTLFSKDIKWEFSPKNIKSLSKNSAYMGEKLEGKAIAILKKNQIQFC